MPRGVKRKLEDELSTPKVGVKISKRKSIKSKGQNPKEAILIEKPKDIKLSKRVIKAKRQNDFVYLSDSKNNKQKKEDKNNNAQVDKINMRRKKQSGRSRQ